MKLTRTAAALCLLTVLIPAFHQTVLSEKRRPHLITSENGNPGHTGSSRYIATLDANLRRRVAALPDTIQLELGQEPVELKRTSVEIRRLGNVTWTGKVRGKRSSVVLTLVDDFLFGRVEIEGQIYLIEPSAAGYSVTREGQAEGNSLAEDVLIPPASSAPPMAFEGGEDGSQIDLLIFYTSQLYNRYTTALPAMIQYYVDVANAAYANSGVNTRLRIVGVEPYTGAAAAEGIDVQTALQSVTGDATIGSLRDAYKADMVSLLRLFENSACGIAWLMQTVSSSFAPHAFSVVEVRPMSDANPYYCHDTTLAHELGHNMGCAHDRDHATASTSGAYSYSYGHDLSGTFATIMSYDNPRITYFSTPLVNYDGHPIGIPEGQPNSADNARTINNTRITVANFRVAAEPDLSIAKSHVADFVAGEVGEYSLLIRNAGSQSTTTQITVTDTLPAGLTYSNATGTSWNCGASGQTVQCTTSQSLAAGASSMISLTVAVGGSAVPQVINTASVSCPDDLNPTNNSSTDVAAVLQVPVFQSEVGKAAVDHNWRRVDLNQVFSNPVVVAKPLSFRDAQPGVLRMRNVTSTSFEIRVQEWNYLDQVHPLEEVTYLVMEKGHWTLADGSQVEAGTIDTSSCGVSSFTSVNFTSAFPARPLVFTSVESSYGADAVTTRLRSVTASGFQITMQEQEKDPAAAQYNSQWHTTERLSFIAFEKRAGQLSGSPYQAGEVTCNSSFKLIAGTPYQLKVEEEQSWDTEVDHVDETIGYLLVTDGSDSFFLADIQTTNGGDPVSVRHKKQGVLEAGEVQVDHNWKKVIFAGVYANPVIVAKPLSINGSDPAVVRIRNLTANSFEIRVQEFEYLDQVHVPERVTYLVMESGRRTLPDGKVIEAGTVDWAQLNPGASSPLAFTAPFPTTPVVFSSVVSANGPDAVQTRNSAVTTGGFRLALQEQEKEPYSTSINSQYHTTERVGYIAVEQGSGILKGGSPFEVGAVTGLDHNFKTVSFALSYATAPLFFADMQTMSGTDPAGLRYRNRTGISVEVQVAEDQSWDSETWHTTENVGYMIIGWSGSGVVVY